MCEGHDTVWQVMWYGSDQPMDKGVRKIEVALYYIGAFKVFKHDTNKKKMAFFLWFNTLFPTIPPPPQRKLHETCTCKHTWVSLPKTGGCQWDGKSNHTNIIVSPHVSRNSVYLAPHILLYQND